MSLTEQKFEPRKAFDPTRKLELTTDTTAPNISTRPGPAASSEEKRIDATVRSILETEKQRNELLADKVKREAYITELEEQIKGQQLDIQRFERDHAASDAKITMLEGQLNTAEAQRTKLGFDLVAVITQVSTMQHSMKQILKVASSSAFMVENSTEEPKI